MNPGSSQSVEVFRPFARQPSSNTSSMRDLSSTYFQLLQNLLADFQYQAHAYVHPRALGWSRFPVKMWYESASQPYWQQRRESQPCELFVIAWLSIAIARRLHLMPYLQKPFFCSFCVASLRRSFAACGAPTDASIKKKVCDRERHAKCGGVIPKHTMVQWEPSWTGFG